MLASVAIASNLGEIEAVLTEQTEVRLAAVYLWTPKAEPFRVLRAGEGGGVSSDQPAQAPARPAARILAARYRSQRPAHRVI